MSEITLRYFKTLITVHAFPVRSIFSREGTGSYTLPTFSSTYSSWSVIPSDTRSNDAARFAGLFWCMLAGAMGYVHVGVNTGSHSDML